MKDDNFNMSIINLRKEYRLANLLETDVNADPIVQFLIWFNEAIQAKIPEPNAMSVSTIGNNGKPSSRIVLLKEVDTTSFTWFSNYHSRKGQEIKSHPHIALLFYWAKLERQIRVEGKTERITKKENDNYFASRPLLSQVSAIASNQSQPINNRKILEAKFSAVKQQYGKLPVRPNHWGGYRVFPERIEFWQGRPSRLHDRIVYIRNANNIWHRQRLQP